MASKFLLADLGGGGGFAFPAASAGGVLVLVDCPLVLVVDEFDCKEAAMAFAVVCNWFCAFLAASWICFDAFAVASS